MKLLFLSFFLAWFYPNAISQKKDKLNRESILAEVSENACKCVDSINVYNKEKAQVSKEIGKCIDKQTGAYQMASSFLQIDSLSKSAKEVNGKKEINISLDLNENSQEYKKYYYDIERYMMDNCKSLKDKVASNNKQSKKSFSDNAKAQEFYSKGLKESEKENYKSAIEYYQKAVQIDSAFAFAWDNIGICYRKAGDFDNALMAYKKSLEIDPEGLMPLQNIAVVYQYKKEYQLAIDAYEKLASIDKGNPEIYYGIGQIYTMNLNEYEKGLEHMCKAYNLYIEQKSPYRTDAEKIIQIIYSEMKKQGKGDKFNEILKANNITPTK